MGADSSYFKMPARREPERPPTVPRSAPKSQYYDVKKSSRGSPLANSTHTARRVQRKCGDDSEKPFCSTQSRYVESGSRSTTTSRSTESTTTSEDTDEKKERKIADKTARSLSRGHTPNPFKSLDGLSSAQKLKKSEDMLRRLWKRPPPSWDKITAVTSITTEKMNTLGQVADDVRLEVEHDFEKVIYDIPLEYCHLRVPRARTSRSCPDPWRRHGAHVKLCEIGGWIPETRNKNAKPIPIKRGTIPPAPPKSKPLQTIDDYIKALKK